MNYKYYWKFYLYLIVVGKIRDLFCCNCMSSNQVECIQCYLLELRVFKLYKKNI